MIQHGRVFFVPGLKQHAPRLILIFEMKVENVFTYFEVNIERNFHIANNIYKPHKLLKRGQNMQQ
jgi:hypothetical protein